MTKADENQDDTVQNLPIGLPKGDDNLPVVAEEVDVSQLKHFVTQIRSAEEQVGQHIINALQDEETVAVLTTIVVAPDGGQHMVSVGLDPETMGQVQEFLVEAENKRDEEVPCVGFHCYVKYKNKNKKKQNNDPKA